MITNAINANINFVYFCMNFTSTFIEKCWKGDVQKINHYTDKFNEVYKRRGTGVIPFFFIELDRKNQLKFSAWINENYVGFPDLHDENDKIES